MPKTVTGTRNKLASDPSAALIRWDTMETGDTITAYSPMSQEAAFATVQAVGVSWGGATVTLEGSNDGINYVPLLDTRGDSISFTANGYAEISTAFGYIRPSITGGTSDNINLLVSMRG